MEHLQGVRPKHLSKSCQLLLDAPQILIRFRSFSGKTVLKVWWKLQYGLRLWKGWIQNGGWPELVYSNLLITTDYRTSNRLAVKSTVIEDHFLHE